MRLRILILALSAILPQLLMASRVKSEWKTYTQPDGTTLLLQQCGDEHFSCYRTADGRLMALDSLGFFRALSAEQAGEQAQRARKAMRRLPAINTQWDAERVYRQMVVLVSFADKDFAEADTPAFYNAMFNEPGFHYRNSAGCVADYFREQSGGLFNMEFDIFGPYKLETTARTWTTSNHNNGRPAMQAAVEMLLQEQTGLDFAPYDWDEDGYVNQVIFIFAGYGANTGGNEYNGYVWPNTNELNTTFTTHDGKKIRSYTVSAELWPNNVSCGMGTVCHEFSHSLGLPDIYPTNGWTYSAVDEWDLMDGGNFTNYGWCPPNYSALEKMLLGWLTPIELTEPVSISNMKPVSEGGDVYLVGHTDSEYLLLENRQHTGWDAGNPGSGLLVFHVNYKPNLWRENTLNDVTNKLNYSLYHADRLDYDQWDALLDAWGARSSWQNSQRMNNWHLSSSPYPWATDSTETNNELTDTSVPATVMYNSNADGSTALGKPITHITVSADGLVSFDFMGGSSTAIERLCRDVADDTRTLRPALYDLRGNRHAAAATRGLYIERRKDGTIRKVIK